MRTPTPLRLDRHPGSPTTGRPGSAASGRGSRAVCFCAGGGVRHALGPRPEPPAGQTHIGIASRPGPHQLMITLANLVTSATAISASESLAEDPPFWRGTANACTVPTSEGWIMLKPLRLLTFSLALLLASTAGVVIADSEPASAASGCNHDLCLSTPASQDPTYEVGLLIAPSYTGSYHVHLWESTHPTEDYNTPAQRLEAGGIYVETINLRATDIGSIHRHQTICGELWLWREGRYHSRGLPCITH
jgi:hypothetical protein